MNNSLPKWSEEQKESLKKEAYMSHKMLAYFQEKLINWRKKITKEINEETSHIRHQIYENTGDGADKEEAEIERWGELSKVTHDKTLLNEIDKALTRIKNGSYGYCLQTGEPIGFERLEAWPIAELTHEAEEKKEALYHRLNP